MGMYLGEPAPCDDRWAIGTASLKYARSQRAIARNAAVIAPFTAWNAKLVAPTGVEPVARGLGNRCSIRLSYGATASATTYQMWR